MLRFIKILSILAVFTVALSSISFADSQEIINWARYKATADPGVDSVTKATTWTLQPVSDYSNGLLTTPITINAGTSIWVGVKNSAAQKVKYLRMRLTGTNINAVTIGATTNDVYGVVYGAPNVKTAGSNLPPFYQEATAFQADYVFNPQPDHEVFKITATGSTVTITNFFVDTHCTVPSLTQYGLAILVLMLIATAVVIYRRHRRVMA
jgi:hypothetical protein